MTVVTINFSGQITNFLPNKKELQKDMTAKFGENYLCTMTLVQTRWLCHDFLFNLPLHTVPLEEGE